MIPKASKPYTRGFFFNDVLGLDWIAWVGRPRKDMRDWYFGNITKLEVSCQEEVQPKWSDKLTNYLVTTSEVVL